MSTDNRSLGKEAAESNRAYFSELGVLELFTDVKKHFPGAQLELEDKKTGRVIKGRLGGSK